MYKHVIDGSERKDELEQKLLGVDSQTGEEVFKQVMFSMKSSIRISDFSMGKTEEAGLGKSEGEEEFIVEEEGVPRFE